MEHRPFEPNATAFHGEFGQRGQQGLPVALAAMGRLDEQIFEIKSWFASERRKNVKEEGIADDAVFILSQKHLGIRPRAEQVQLELRLIKTDRMGQALILSERTDKPGDGRHVGNSSSANHSSIVGARQNSQLAHCSAGGTRLQ